MFNLQLEYSFEKNVSKFEGFEFDLKEIDKTSQASKKHQEFCPSLIVSFWWLVVPNVEITETKPIICLLIKIWLVKS